MTELNPGTGNALRRIVQERQSEHRIPGVAAGVGRSGELLWSDGVGAVDLDRPDVAPDEDTQFLIASITKTFTAVMTMQLRDEGKLSLDDTLDRFVPESKHEGVTIRQVLSHVSGMQREPVGDIWETLTYPDRVELVSGWNEAERILKPHHRHHYSNLSYAMLGEVIARLDDRAYVESLHARLLDPLGLKRTTMGLTGPHATGYYVPPFTDVPVREPVLDLLATAPAGGLASTVSDLVTWGSFLADPVAEVLAPDTLEEMIQPQIMADLDGWRLGWGLGFMLFRAGDRIFFGHDGGMPGHITSVVVHRPTGTIGTVLMSSTSSPPPSAFAIALAEHVIEHDAPAAETWTPGATVPDELRGLLGTWFSEGAAFTFSVRRETLEARQDGAPKHRPPSVFTKIGDDLYRTESGRETGELLRITRDADGRVTKLNWATYLFTREPYAFGEWL
jgi:CubicO group peptidase (beta-lactamase class C family)